MTGEPHYSWIVRDGDDDPWTLLSYRWTDREAALENADHWRNCSRHGYAQVKTVQVVGDDNWVELEDEPAAVSREPVAVPTGGSVPFTGRRFVPEYTFGTPVTPSAFLPMDWEPDPPPGLSRKTFSRLREAMRKEGLTS